MILNSQGTSVIARDYRGDVSLGRRMTFVKRVIRGEEEPECGYVTPIFVVDNVVYAYIQHESLYFVALGCANVNCTLMLTYLHRLVQVLLSYFSKVTEEKIQDNFTVVYEILDEVMDFGFPQVTEPDILKEFIIQHDLAKAISDAFKRRGNEQIKAAPIAATGVVGWRKEGLKYRRNEVFLDVMEDVQMVVNPEGTTLSAEIKGKLAMDTRLSGMPDVKIGFNDRVSFDRALGNDTFDGSGETQIGSRGAIELEDVKMHQCVRLNSFGEDRTISFIPPDGKFDLMSYRISSAVIRPLVRCTVQETSQGSATRIAFFVKLRTNFKATCNAKDLAVEVPVPSDASNPRFITLTGSAKYEPSINRLVWMIKQLPGKEETSLQAEFSLPSIRNPEDISSYSKQPIVVRFSVPYFSVSGIQIRYLKVSEKSGYESVPWIRYLSSGTVTTRRR